MTVRFCILFVMVFGQGCALGPGAPPPTPAFSAASIAFLDTIQPRSVRLDQELCGYFGVDENDAFVATEPVQGTKTFCDLPEIPDEMTVLASYHTHAAFTPDYDSEVPSPSDVRTDAQDRIFGNLATPGGRVWLVDWRDRTAHQICGLVCVYQDPNFVPLDAGPIAERYTFTELQRR